jgi:hypothetical protein
MKPFLLIISALLSAIAVDGREGSEDSNTWQTLSRASKGVGIAKVSHEEIGGFVFFPATNRSRPTSTLISAGVIFSSLDDAIAFMEAKPPGVVVVFPITPDSLVDDAKILLRWSESELRAFNEALRAPAQVWNTINSAKGVNVAKMNLDDVEYFVFFSGANYGPRSSWLQASRFRFDTLKAAQEVVRAKPAAVILSEPRSDHVYDDAKIMRRMTMDERAALDLER